MAPKTGGIRRKGNNRRIKLVSEAVKMRCFMKRNTAKPNRRREG
jgi:hypothetical protein